MGAIRRWSPRTNIATSGIRSIAAGLPAGVTNVYGKQAAMS